MINIGEPATGITVLGKLICRINGSHVWSPEDFNEFTMDMDIGDEATLRCKRCNIKIVTIEKRRDDLKWTPHVKEAVLYELTDEAKKKLSTDNLKKGGKTNLDKFQEANK